jgi:hypothetical protein
MYKSSTDAYVIRHRHRPMCWQLSMCMCSSLSAVYNATHKCILLQQVSVRYKDEVHPRKGHEGPEGGV